MGMDVFMRTLTVNSFKGNGFGFQSFLVDYKIKISDMTFSEIIPVLGYKSVISIIHITNSVKCVQLYTYMHTYKVYTSNISILKRVIMALKILRKVAMYFNTLNVQGRNFFNLFVNLKSRCSNYFVVIFILSCTLNDENLSNMEG